MQCSPNSPPTVKVVIGDDHTLIVSAVKALIDARCDVASVACANDGLTTIALVKDLTPDLLILDLALPYASGIEILAEVRRWSKDTRTLVLTGMTAAGMLRSALDAGALGIALKSTPMDRLSTGIDTVLRGTPWISEDVASILEHVDHTSDLTSRQAQILNMIAQGMTNAEIGMRLGISAKTVDNHRTRLMAKLGVKSRAELLAVALKSGLLDSYLQL